MSIVPAAISIALFFPLCCMDELCMRWDETVHCTQPSLLVFTTGKGRGSLCQPQFLLLCSKILGSCSEKSISVDTSDWQQKPCLRGETGSIWVQFPGSSSRRMGSKRREGFSGMMAPVRILHFCLPSPSSSLAETADLIPHGPLAPLLLLPPPVSPCSRSLPSMVVCIAASMGSIPSFLPWPTLCLRSPTLSLTYSSKIWTGLGYPAFLSLLPSCLKCT